MTTRMEGREKVLRQLSLIPPKVRGRVKVAISVSADEVVALMQRLVPVSGGRNGGSLKRSIRKVSGSVAISQGIAKRKKGASLSASEGQGDEDLTTFVLAGDAEAYYAHMVEFGTDPHINGGIFAGTQHPGTHPQPFFLPAWRSRKGPTRARITRAMKKGILETLGR